MSTVDTVTTLSNNNITIDTSGVTFDASSLVLSSANGSYLNNYSNPIQQESDGCIIIGSSGTTELYVVEKWQSKNPIDMGDGLYTSLKEDLLTQEEIQELIYGKLEEQHPDKAIKLGLNNDIVIRKYMIPVEIKYKD